MLLKKENKLLEAQIKEVQNRCDQAEQNALKGGEKARIGIRIKFRKQTICRSQKNLCKSERQLKEQTYTQEEDTKNHERIQTMIINHQQKII